MINKYIYLTSSSYSGSTLLAAIMNAHPEIASVGELSAIEKVKNYDNYLCSCGKPFYECEFWNKFENELKRKSPELSINNVRSIYKPEINKYLDRLALHLFKNGFLNDIRDLLINSIPAYNNYFKKATCDYIDLAKIILKIYNKNIFFDASKNPLRIGPLNKELGDKLKVIHLVKDGRGVLDSFLRYNPNVNEKKVIKNWVKLNKFINHKLKKLPEKNIMVLTYYDLANNTEETLKKLTNFIGVAFEENLYNFNNYEHHILGNTKMRLSSTNDIIFDKKWKKTLTIEQLKLFESIGREMNSYYGNH